MLTYDLDGNILEDYDLTKGYLISQIRIKADAKPIDNETKGAWNNDDYEEIQIYKPFTEEQLQPTPDDDRDSLLVDLDMRLTMLELNI